MSIDYSKDASWIVDKLRFEYLGGSYSGRGRLHWNPKRGFHLDVFVDRDGAELPKTIELGKVGIPTASEIRAVRMHLAGCGRALTCPLILADQWELVSQSRLDVEFPSVLFTRPFPRRSGSTKHIGGGLFEVGKGLIFPDILKTETWLGERQIRQASSSGGIDYKDDSLTLRAWRESETQLRMHWAMSPTVWERAHAWKYAEAAEAALSFLCGRTVRLLERTTQRCGLEFCERRKRSEMTDLGLMSLVPREQRNSHCIGRNEFVRLSRFFARGGEGTTVARLIFAQIVEARRQQTRAARELLCANALDAALRTLSGRPYKRNDKATKIEAIMEEFRTQYLTEAWVDACKKILSAYRRLRNKNAHPDWLTGKGGGLSDVDLDKRFDDLIRVVWFCGYMTQALAGFGELEPKFPVPHKEWGPLLTQISGTPDRKETGTGTAKNEDSADDNVGPCLPSSA